VHDLATFIATLAFFALGAIPLALVGLLGSHHRR
jgi:hypothetical protein